MFLFENNRYVNSIFVNEIKDKEYSDFSSCDNIKFDNINACITSDDESIDSVYVSSIIKTHVEEESFIDKFFLVVDETIPIGTDVIYYLITDENDEIKIIPNGDVPLIIDKAELPKSFRIKAKLKSNGTSSPKINAIAVMYYDSCTDENIGLKHPDISSKSNFKEIQGVTIEELNNNIISLNKIKYDDIKTNNNKITMYANGTAKKTVSINIPEVHSHNNKSALDNITLDNINFINSIPDKYVTNEKLLMELDKDIHFNVEKFGVVPGVDADVQENTRIIQYLINNNDDLVLYFPSKKYRIGKLYLGTNKNITFRGKSSAFATAVNKNVENPVILDTYSRILIDLENTIDENGQEIIEHFLEHTNCTIILDKISFINGTVSDETNIIEWYKKNAFVKTGANITKGKIFATECSFIGFRQVGGDIDMYNEASNEFDKEKKLLHCCFLANRCRFTENIVALGNLVDGRIIDCTFNKNDYAILMNQNSGFTTIANSRFEWNRKNAIYSYKCHDLTINACEFDRNGFAGLYIDSLAGGNITSNTFRRNGALISGSVGDEVGRGDYENNLHFVIKNSDCVNVSSTITVVKNILDTAGSSISPTNVCQFSNNTNSTLIGNNLTGCTKSDKNDANKIVDNLGCIIENNIIEMHVPDNEPEVQSI